MDLLLVTCLCGDAGQMPVGPLVLAELARQRGWSVAVRDLPPAAGEEAFLATLADCRVVGFSTISSTFHRSLRLAERLKSLYPHVTIVMGGPQATATAMPVMNLCGAVDILFLGEAEAAWIGFLDNQPLAGLAGICFRDQGQVVVTPAGPLVTDLDQWPMPAFDLYPPSRSGLAVPIETGRGCPFLCTYCSTNRFFSRRFRSKSHGRILAEMDVLNLLYRVTSFDLIQDNFHSDRRNIIAFCEAMRQHPRRYTWSISVRPDRVDAGLARLLREAGCEGIYCGVETGSRRLQRLVRKNLNLDRAISHVSQANQAGLATTVSFIIGFPQERLEDLRETLMLHARFAGMANMVTQLHLLSPLQGSQMLSEQQFPLAFDGMPTDFNETEEPWQPAELALFQSLPQLFPHMFYYAGSEVSRQRQLFIAYLIRLAWLYYYNVMVYACRWQPAAWVEFLWHAPIPAALVTDPSFPHHHDRWITLAGQVLASFLEQVAWDGRPWSALLAFDQAFARAFHGRDPAVATVLLPRSLAERHVSRILPDLVWEDLIPFLVFRDHARQVIIAALWSEARLEHQVQSLCLACGACCLDEQGFHCSLDEWRAMARFMKAHLIEVPATAPLAWQGQAWTTRVHYMAKREDGFCSLHDSHYEALAMAGDHGWVRTACGHLQGDGLVWRCGIHAVKPLTCLVFPFTLSPSPDSPGTWQLQEDHRFFAHRGPCSLARALHQDPAFRISYQMWLLHQVEHRSHSRESSDDLCPA